MIITFMFKRKLHAEVLQHRILHAIEDKILKNVELLDYVEFDKSVSVDLVNTYNPVDKFLLIESFMHDESFCSKLLTMIELDDVEWIKILEGRHNANEIASLNAGQAKRLVERLNDESELPHIELSENAQKFCNYLSSAGKPLLGCKIRKFIGYNDEEMKRGEQWSEALTN